MLNGKKETEDFSDLSDEELVSEYKDNERALMELFSRYESTIRKKAEVMSYGKSTEADDLMQEGLIGFLSSVKTYRSDKNVKFSYYAKVCITNRIKTALSRNNNIEIPVENINEEDVEKNLTSPESILMAKEDYAERQKKIVMLLSAKESEIFGLYVKGSSYDQMARQLHISPKIVDNALQRVRRKLKRAWRAEKSKD